MEIFAPSELVAFNFWRCIFSLWMDFALMSTEKIKTKEYIKRYLKRCVSGPYSLLCGLSVTLRYFFNPKRIVTEQYPENKKTLKMHNRFRGHVVMVEDEKVKSNRLTLLSNIKSKLDLICDFSKLTA